MTKKHKYRIDTNEYKAEVNIRLARWRRQMVARLSGEQGHRCAYCQRKLVLPVFGDRVGKKNRKRLATLEHLLPKCDENQTNRYENLVAACSKCNQLRATSDPIKFYNKIHSPMPTSYLRTQQRDQQQKLHAQKLKAARMREDPEAFKAKQQRTFDLAWYLVLLFPDQYDDLNKIFTRKKKKLLSGQRQIEQLRISLSGFAA